MSHAGVALLPSSLAMQTAMLANSYLLRAVGTSKDAQNLGNNITKAIFWYFIGGIFGWPFALALRCLLVSTLCIIPSSLEASSLGYILKSWQCYWELLVW